MKIQIQHGTLQALLNYRIPHLCAMQLQGQTLKVMGENGVAYLVSVKSGNWWVPKSACRPVAEPVNNGQH
jgi:predicted phage-related endonuclease